IRLKDVEKWYGRMHVLRGITLDVAPGEKLVICGPSGSGKSTLIRCINQLEAHQRGSITVEGIALSDDPKVLRSIRREVGMVFQGFHLFP
ncbi:ATP-binding cassette domain-containing protein, partial [Campylobacter lari]|nr:ATP-binding cassette domain-containing protein [Campylobacter lari]